MNIKLLRTLFIGSIAAFMACAIPLVTVNCTSKTNINSYLETPDLGKVHNNTANALEGALCYKNEEFNYLKYEVDYKINDITDSSAIINGIGKYTGNFEISFEIVEPVPDGFLYITVPQPPYEVEIGVGIILPVFAVDDEGNHVDFPSGGTFKWILMIPLEYQENVVIVGDLAEDKINLENYNDPLKPAHDDFRIYIRCCYTSAVTGITYVSNLVHSTFIHEIYPS